MISVDQHLKDHSLSLTWLCFNGSEYTNDR